MAKTPRGLASELAVVVCQLGELAKISRKLPPLGSLCLRETQDGEPVIRCHIPRSFDTPPQDTTVHEQQIDAIRAWATVLGSDLALGEPRHFYGSAVVRTLETAGALPNGLAVEVYTLLAYDPDAPEYHGKPAAPAIAVA